MPLDNRRAEGRRPPHRGRSEQEDNSILGQIRDEPDRKPLPREACAEERRRGRLDLRPEGQNET